MPQDAGLAEVVRAFGDAAALELKRSMKRLGSRFYDLTTGSLQRIERFAWYEAAGPSFRTRRWALTDAGVFALRDEHDGLSQLFALHAPLPLPLPLQSKTTTTGREAIVKVAHHFLGEMERVGVQGDVIEGVAGPRINNGVLTLDLVAGNQDGGRLRHVHIALATGAVTLEDGRAWQTQRRDFFPLDDDDDATEHIKTGVRDPDSTFDDGTLNSATDNDDD